jgi:hypothetical protein
MDPVRFDALTKTLSSTGTRRGLLLRLAPLPLAGALALLLGREAILADGSGAIVGGHRHRNRGNHHHTRENGDDKCNKKCGSCARCKNGKCKSKPDGRACEGNGVCSDGVCRTSGSSGGPAPATCPGLGLTCAAAGKACCPGIDSKIVCAGGGTGDFTCQDCTAPLDANRALCHAPPGNQCCDGNPSCFVGVRLDPLHVGELICLCNGLCASDLVVCATDVDCSAAATDFPICVQATSPCSNCPSTDATYCGKPCGAATC